VTSLDHSTLREGEATTWRARLDAPGADSLVVSVAEGPAWETRPHPAVTLSSVQGGANEARVVVTATRWGRHQIGPAAIAVESVWGAFRCGPAALTSAEMTTLPLPAIFDNAAPLPDASGLVGSHRSRRVGDGAEFAVIRPFTVGDRLRRVHWPVTLRTGELHVTASVVDVDSEIALVVDGTDDVGEHGGLTGPASSLDRSVRAAGALAEHFLRRGDRVGLRTVGTQRFVQLPPTAGRTHLRRVLHELTVVAPGGPRARRATPRQLGIGSGAFVIVLTPLLSEASVGQVAHLARHHRGVVVVDTLPDDIGTQRGEEPSLDLAWRIRLLERSADIRRLNAVGVPVVPWRGPGSLDTVLRDLTRRSHAPRAGAR
jgi:uncharacterized protein (DUF58 family)